MTISNKFTGSLSQLNTNGLVHINTMLFKICFDENSDIPFHEKKLIELINCKFNDNKTTCSSDIESSTITVSVDANDFNEKLITYDKEDSFINYIDECKEILSCEVMARNILK